MSQFNSATYDVQRPTGRCAFTDNELIPGTEYVATLVEDDEQPGGLRRVDVSLEAWDGGARPPQLFSYWKSVIPEPEGKKKLFVDDTVLMNLLHRLGEDDRQDRVAFRFVLALILMRKKLLRYDGTEYPESESGEGVSGGQGGVWKMTPKVDVTKGHFGKWDEANPVRITDPALDEAGIQQVTEQLGQVLEAEL